MQYYDIKVSGDYLLYGAFDSLAAYNIAEGKFLWNHPRGRFMNRMDPPWSSWRPRMAIDGNQLLLAGGDGLLALDLKTGKPLWKFPTPSPVVAGPVVRNGVAYFMDGSVENDMINMVSSDSWWTANAPGRDKPHYLYALDLSKARQLDLLEEEPDERPTEK